MAANNVSFTSKMFYATIPHQELGVIGTLSKTYKLIGHYDRNISINSTIYEIKKFSMSFPENMKVFQIAYWIPKCINHKLIIDL